MNERKDKPQPEADKEPTVEEIWQMIKPKTAKDGGMVSLSDPEEVKAMVRNFLAQLKR